MLRPEIIGRFESTAFFKVAKAYIISDATDKKYDLFSSVFVDLGGGIIYDTTSKLLWQQNPGIFPEDVNWKEAPNQKPTPIRMCENLNLSGITRWRLPSLINLKRMYNH